MDTSFFYAVYLDDSVFLYAQNTFSLDSFLPVCRSGQRNLVMVSQFYRQRSGYESITSYDPEPGRHVPATCIL